MGGGSSKEIVESSTKTVEAGLTNFTCQTDCGEFESLTKDEAYELGKDFAEGYITDVQMAKRVPMNFKMACKGNTPGKKNKVSTCILVIETDGKLQLNAVLATPLGDNKYDVVYIYCNGDFKIQFPQQITMVKDHYNYWGIWNADSESYQAETLPLQKNDMDNILQPIMDVCMTTAVAIKQENVADIREELLKKAQIKQ